MDTLPEFELPPLPLPNVFEVRPDLHISGFSGPDTRAYGELCARTAVASYAARPIDMVLHCPACGSQHIDTPEPARALGYVECDGMPGMAYSEAWPNPPHRSHLCHNPECGHIWRPADVATNGIAAVKTAGKADSPIARSASAPVVAEPAEPPTLQQLANFVEEPGTHKALLGDYRGPFSMGVGKRDGELVVIVQVPDDANVTPPFTVMVGNAKVRIVVESGFKVPSALSAVETELAPSLTEEQIKRHTLKASECPPNSEILLASSVRRLLARATQTPLGHKS